MSHVSRDDGGKRVCRLADGRLAARAAHRRRALQFDQLLVHERPRVARVPTQLLLQQAHAHAYAHMLHPFVQSSNTTRTLVARCTVQVRVGTTHGQRFFRTLNSGGGD